MHVYPYLVLEIEFDGQHLIFEPRNVEKEEP
jgi:hypothetical protein